MLHNRIVEARNKAKLSQEELAKALEIGKRTLADYEKGDTEPKASTLIGIAENCNVDPNWLLTGREEGDYLPVAVSAHSEDDKNTVSLNYYPDIVAAAGYGAINESNVHPQIMKFDRRFLEEFLNVRRFDSIDIIRVIGDSMEPYIHDGEVVLVERHSDVRNGETVIASVNGHIYVKRYHADPFGKWVKLVSENNIYGSLELEGDQLEYFYIIGIVRAKIKAF